MKFSQPYKAADGRTTRLFHPVRGQQYTFREIVEKLYLRDSPCLGFVYQGVDCVVQDSHVSENVVLQVPGFADSPWTYVKETDEWIPVFRYAGEAPVTDFLDIEPGLDAYTGEPDGSYWVVPKGTKREQYLARGVVPAATATHALNQCPFCHKFDSVMVGDKVKLGIHTDTEFYGFTVYCSASPANGGCGANCGWYETEDEAAAHWNRYTTGVWHLVNSAVRAAMVACENATGMRADIRRYVNANAITHAVLGTDPVDADPSLLIDKANPDLLQMSKAALQNIANGIPNPVAYAKKCSDALTENELKEPHG